jgi:hypothetical protein
VTGDDTIKGIRARTAGDDLEPTTPGAILYKLAAELGVVTNMAMFSRLCGMAPNYLADSGGNLSAEALANFVRVVRGAGADPARNAVAEKAHGFLVGGPR